MKRRRGTTTCTDVMHHAGEDLDELLAGDVYARIRHHLDHCPNCEAYIDSLKKVVKLYRRYPDQHLGNTVRKRLHAVVSLTH